MLRCLNDTQTKLTRLINIAINTPDQDSDRDLTLAELDNALKNKRKTSPGADKIAHLMLYHTGRKARQFILDSHPQTRKKGRLPTNIVIKRNQ